MKKKSQKYLFIYLYNIKFWSVIKKEDKYVLEKLVEYLRLQEAERASGMDMSTGKHLHCPRISFREVWKGQGREGGQGEMALKHHIVDRGEHGRGWTGNGWHM